MPILANYPKVRVILYLLSLATSIATAFVAVFAKDLVAAFTLTTAILGTASGYTAITNVPKADSGTDDEGSGPTS